MGLPGFTALISSSAQGKDDRIGKEPPIQTAGFTPPKLPTPPIADSNEILSIRWSELALYGAMGLAALVLVFALAKFARRQWPEWPA